MTQTDAPLEGEIVDESADKADEEIVEQALQAVAESGEASLLPYIPTNFDKAWKLANYLAATEIVPKELRQKPGAVLSIMARGAILGLDWSTAVQTFYVVHGRVGIPADVMAALCDADPEFDYFECIEATPTKAVVEAKKKRWDKPRQYTVTMEDVKRAGYLDGKHSQLWATRPAIMLRHMAEREAARMWNQKRLAGLYDREEVDDLAREEKNITPTPRVSLKDLDAQPVAKGGDAPREAPAPSNVQGGEEKPREDLKRDSGSSPPKYLPKEAQARIAKALAAAGLTFKALEDHLIPTYGTGAMSEVPAEEEPELLRWIKGRAK